MAALKVGSKVQVIQIGAALNAAPQQDKIIRDTATMWVTENNGSFMKSTGIKRGHGKKAVFNKIEAAEEPKTEEKEQQLPVTLPATGKLTQEQVQQFVQYYENKKEEDDDEVHFNLFVYFAVYTVKDESKLHTQFITESQFAQYKTRQFLDTVELKLLIHSKHARTTALEDEGIKIFEYECVKVFEKLFKNGDMFFKYQSEAAVLNEKEQLNIELTCLRNIEGAKKQLTKKEITQSLFNEIKSNALNIRDEQLDDIPFCTSLLEANEQLNIVNTKLKILKLKKKKNTFLSTYFNNLSDVKAEIEKGEMTQQDFERVKRSLDKTLLSSKVYPLQNEIDELNKLVDQNDLMLYQEAMQHYKSGL